MVKCLTANLKSKSSMVKIHWGRGRQSVQLETHFWYTVSVPGFTVVPREDQLLGDRDLLLRFRVILKFLYGESSGSGTINHQWFNTFTFALCEERFDQLPQTTMVYQHVFFSSPVILSLGLSNSRNIDGSTTWFVIFSYETDKIMTDFDAKYSTAKQFHTT